MDKFPFDIKKLELDGKEVDDGLKNSVMLKDFIKTQIIEFPKEVREFISESFKVPQLGNYHNEGDIMESHIDMMFQYVLDIESFKKLLLDLEVEDEDKKYIFELYKKYNDQIKKYILLHDIGKARKMQLTMKSDQKKRIDSSIEDFNSKNIDEISSVSYIGHGVESSNMIKELDEEVKNNINISEEDLNIILTAIENHDKAYSFNEFNPNQYKKNLSELPEDVQEFLILATLIDIGSSLRPGGVIDLSGVSNLIKSKKQSEEDIKQEEILKAKKEKLTFEITEKMSEVIPEYILPKEARGPILSKITQYIIEKNIQQINESIIKSAIELSEIKDGKITNYKWNQKNLEELLSKK